MSVNLKYYLFTFAILFAIFGANAQNDGIIRYGESSKTRKQNKEDGVIRIKKSESTDEPVLRFGMRIGGNFSSMTDVSNSKRNFGFMAGFDLDYNLKNDMLIMLGLEFHQKGVDSDNATDMSIDLSFLQIPLHAGKVFRFNESTKLIIHGGPYLGIGLDGKLKFNKEVEGETPGETVIKRVGYDVFKKYSGVKPLKNLELGLSLGARFDLDSFNVGLIYEWGLTNLADGIETLMLEEMKLKNRNLSLSVGYKF